MDSIETEIDHRNRSEKEYAESEVFGLKMLNLHQQILGIDRNKISNNEYGDATPKEMLKNYRQVILSDKDGSIVEHESKSKVLMSLENSIKSMGYQNLTKRELDNLKPGDYNSFLISPKSASGHQFSIVTRKDQNGDFVVSTIDKERSKLGLSQVHTYTIEGDKSKNLAKLIRPQLRLINIDYREFYNKLKDMSKQDEEKPYMMAGQKAENCYVKEVEAGLKYALWSRNPKGEKVKWPISTLEMHQKFTDELVKKLEQSGYDGVKEVIKSEFEKYKSEKRETNLKGWERKKERLSQGSTINDEFFTEETIDNVEKKENIKYELDQIERDHGSFMKEMDYLDKEGFELDELYEKKSDEYDLENQKSKALNEKLNKYKKLNPISKFFKRSKIKAVKRELQKINDRLRSLKGDLNSAEKKRDSYEIRRENYIDKNRDYLKFRFKAEELKEELNDINEFKEKNPHLFKINEPALSKNEKSPHRLLKDKTPNQPSTSRTGSFPIPQKSSLNERRQSAESVASLKNSNLSRSSSQVNIQR